MKKHTSSRKIGVASTKAYTSQIIALVLFGLMMAEDRKSMQGRCQEVRGRGKIKNVRMRCVDT